MILSEIDHVAIAVNDLEAAITYYQDAFGATVHHREIVESDGVEEALIKVAESYIQLTSATNENSPIAKCAAIRFSCATFGLKQNFSILESIIFFSNE